MQAVKGWLELSQAEKAKWDNPPEAAKKPLVKRRNRKPVKKETTAPVKQPPKAAAIKIPPKVSRLDLLCI